MSSGGDVKDFRALNVPFRRHSERLVKQSVISVHVACPSKIMSLTMTVPMSGEQDSNLQPLASKTSKQPPLSPQMCSTVRDVDPRDSQENPPHNSTATDYFMPAHKKSIPFSRDASLSFYASWFSQVTNTSHITNLFGLSSEGRLMSDMECLKFMGLFFN